MAESVKELRERLLKQRAAKKANVERSRPRTTTTTTVPKDLVKFGGKDQTFDGESLETKRARIKRKTDAGLPLTNADLLR